MHSAPTSRRSLFAVWRWPKWGIAVLLLPLAYFVSIPPILYATVCLSPKSYQTVESLAAPADWCVARCGALEEVWTWEWKVIFGIFGAPRHQHVNQLPPPPIPAIDPPK